MLDHQTIQQLAERVLQAQDQARTLTKLTDEFPQMSIDDSYAVQDALSRHWQARGERITGMKAGLTSKAKMEQMGVHVPSFGILSSAMAREDGCAIEIEQLVHPRVEAELAFVTGSELSGADCSLEQVLEATIQIMPAVEVIDSRYEKFKFDLVSVIADNGSSARYVLGKQTFLPQQIDLAGVVVTLARNGNVQTQGISSAVLNHPGHAVAMLVRHLAARGTALPAGSLVMTGGITEAIPVNRGDHIVASFAGMGQIHFRFI